MGTSYPGSGSSTATTWGPVSYPWWCHSAPAGIFHACGPHCTWSGNVMQDPFYWMWLAQEFFIAICNHVLPIILWDVTNLLNIYRLFLNLSQSICIIYCQCLHLPEAPQHHKWEGTYPSSLFSWFFFFFGVFSTEKFSRTYQTVECFCFFVFFLHWLYYCRLEMVTKNVKFPKLASDTILWRSTFNSMKLQAFEKSEEAALRYCTWEWQWKINVPIKWANSWLCNEKIYFISPLTEAFYYELITTGLQRWGKIDGAIT